jgi:hypothetical protein
VLLGTVHWNGLLIAEIHALPLVWMCTVARTHRNVRVDLVRSSRCFLQNEELDVIHARALNVCVGLVRSSRGFGQIEELDLIHAHAHWMSALALWGPVVASDRLKS